MTDDLEDSAQWRDEIETRVGTLEVTVETEAQARAKMDQDMSDLKLEFRAQRGLLQALQETQSEHTATLREHGEMLRVHGEMLRDHGERLVRLEAGQARLEAGLATVHAGVQTIIGLLDGETGQTAE
jgi:chromosome segregation ATPase